jgi:REP element-mobilizing transposase RayT
MEEDHVHLYISIPPVQPLPLVIQRLKWKTSFEIWKDSRFEKHIKNFYYKKWSFWAVWYFITTVWEVSHEIIKNYVASQWKKEIEDECYEIKVD